MNLIAVSLKVLLAVAWLVAIYLIIDLLIDEFVRGRRKQKADLISDSEQFVKDVIARAERNDE